MKVLSLPMGADTGGVSAYIGHAFAGVADWTFRWLVTTPNYIGYPSDLEWTRENIEHYWPWADVIHLHHNMAGPERLTKGWKGYRLPPRPYVVEFHGTGFREDPESYLRQMHRFRALGLVSTLDLWLLAPDETEWLPCPVDIDWLQTQRVDLMDDTIRIAHAPTNRAIKSTDAFIKAMEQLKRQGYPVESVLIEHRPWAECLDIKSSADIYFDQVKLGYGNNAIEAWGMGIPVIAGGADATLDEMERRFGSLPFLHATEETIYDALREMVESPDLRQKYADRGLAHVRRWHDERVVVEQLKDIYLRAAGERGERAA